MYDVRTRKKQLFPQKQFVDYFVLSKRDVYLRNDVEIEWFH